MIIKLVCAVILGFIIGKIQFVELLSRWAYKETGFNRGEPSYGYRNKFWEAFCEITKLSPWGYFG